MRRRLRRYSWWALAAAFLALNYLLLSQARDSSKGGAIEASAVGFGLR